MNTINHFIGMHPIALGAQIRADGGALSVRRDRRSCYWRSCSTAGHSGGCCRCRAFSCRSCSSSTIVVGSGGSATRSARWARSRSSLSCRRRSARARSRSSRPSPIPLTASAFSCWRRWRARGGDDVEDNPHARVESLAQDNEIARTHPTSERLASSRVTNQPGDAFRQREVNQKPAIAIDFVLLASAAQSPRGW